MFCTIWTFFYLLAASLAAADGRYDEAFGAAAVSNGVRFLCVTIWVRLWIIWDGFVLSVPTCLTWGFLNQFSEIIKHYVPIARLMLG